MPDEIDDDDEPGVPSADEGEPREVAAPRGPVPFRYSSELSDEQLRELWQKSPDALGSISLGFVDEGRIINGRQFPEGDGWIVVQPEYTWGTAETVDYVLAAIGKVREQYPEAPPLRVNQISAKEGGYLRPHKSHQSGRDVDLAFYYPTAEPVRVRERERYIDVAKNWALIKALVTVTDVQVILVDRRVMKVIYAHALQSGEDPAWLQTIFKSNTALVKHARRHRDHFHVRFFNGRAQELGRRVAPLLAQRPEQNLLIHRVRRGDTLSHLAARYNSSIQAIRKANRIRGSMLRLSQVLKVPLRGPCTRCPIPPPIEVPARRLPPGFGTEEGPAMNAAADGVKATSAVLNANAPRARASPASAVIEVKDPTAAAAPAADIEVKGPTAAAAPAPSLDANGKTAGATPAPERAGATSAAQPVPDPSGQRAGSPSPSVTTTTSP